MKIAVAVFCLGLLALPARADNVAATAIDQGWINSIDYSGNSTGNYFCGRPQNYEDRGWWDFLRPDVPGTITGVTLRIFSGFVTVDGGPSETVRFGAVQFPAS